MAPEIDTCPEAVHVTYRSLEAAQAAAQERRDKGEKVLALPCRTCGNFRVERVLS